MRLWRFESTGGNWMIALSRCTCVFSPSVDAGVLYVSLRGGEGSLGGLCQAAGRGSACWKIDMAAIYWCPLQKKN